MKKEGVTARFPSPQSTTMDRPIFVFAQPRSGSTLLQRVLNSFDDVLIYGEHLGLLNHVAQSYFEFLNRKLLPTFCSASENKAEVQATALSRLRDAKDFAPHINAFSLFHLRESYAVFTRQLVHAIPQPPTTRWGFKEIRYGLGDSVFEMLFEIFPEATFLFLVRHPCDQIASVDGTGWFEEGVEFRAHRWKQQTLSYLKYHRSHPERTVFLRYEDFTNPDSQACKAALERIGLKYSTKQHEIIFQIGKVGAVEKKPSYPPEMLTRIRCLCLTPELREIYAC